MVACAGWPVLCTCGTCELPHTAVGRGEIGMSARYGSDCSGSCPAASELDVNWHEESCSEEPCPDLFTGNTDVV